MYFAFIHNMGYKFVLYFSWLVCIMEDSFTFYFLLQQIIKATFCEYVHQLSLKTIVTSFFIATPNLYVSFWEYTVAWSLSGFKSIQCPMEITSYCSSSVCPSYFHAHSYDSISYHHKRSLIMLRLFFSWSLLFFFILENPDTNLLL